MELNDDIDSLAELSDLYNIRNSINAKITQNLLQFCKPTTGNKILVPTDILLTLIQERAEMLPNGDLEMSKKLKSKRIVTKKNSDPNGKILLRGKSSPSFNETFSVQSVIRKRYSLNSPQITQVLVKNPEFIFSNYIDDLPRTKVVALTTSRSLTTIKAPGDSSADDQSYGLFASGKVTSNYPAIKGRPYREGDPICDRICAKLFENRIICCIADGCNWGDMPRKAAKRAVKYFIQFIEQNYKEITSIRACGSILLAALAHAHVQIPDVNSIFPTAATTLLGGVLLEIDKKEEPSLDYSWTFVFVSVGDCKAFHYNKATKQVRDLTVMQQNQLDFTAEPAGYIGGSTGKPNLQNLVLLSTSCNDDDIVICVSDGIYDNIDPIASGKLPKDFNLNEKDWKSVPLETSNSIRTKYITDFIADVICLDKEPNVKCITNRLIDHSYQVTSRSREYMEQHPTGKLSLDPTLHPGKLDHASCVCFRVGRVTLSYQEWVKQ